MNLHEYQAKNLFRKYGVNIPRSILAQSPQEARMAADELGGSRWMVKAQVHTGSRGKAGAIRLAKSLDEVEDIATQLLGSAVKTVQTGTHALPINALLIEEALNIDSELYLSLIIDRATQQITFICSSEGGVEIEEIALKTPEKILSIPVDVAAGYFPYIGRRATFALGLNHQQVAPLNKLMDGLYRLFIEKDLSMVEINPLVITEDGELFALDAKISLDDNALFRHPDLQEMRDPLQENQQENQAREQHLNYVSLPGNIGCMVNGAGLSMALLDVIHLHGGEAANFLDVGGSATVERVKEAFRLIVATPSVEVILINIFGGIVRCDLIAQGIITAAQEMNTTLPIIACLQGTHASEGLAILAQSTLSIQTANNLDEAVQKAIAIVNA